MLDQIIRLWTRYYYVYLRGLWGTLWLSAVSVGAASIIGTLLSFMKLSRLKPLNWIVDLYLWVLRGTPALLHLYFFWLLLPRVVPMELSDTQCIIVALIVSASAYVCEIVRSGIQAVDIGQTEAARSLGLSGFNVMTRVVMPQAIKNILPALGNEYITMIKQTSLGSVFFIGELTSAYRTIQAATFLSIPSLIIAGAIYLSVTTILTLFLHLLERRMQKNERTIQA